MRTGLERCTQNRVFSLYFYYAQIGDQILKGPVSIGVSGSKTTKPLSGKKISRTGKLRKITGKKYSIGQFGAFGPSHVTMHNRPSIIPEFPPPLSDGTNPIQAARLRPEENVFQSPISATNAVAPIGPIPGISAKAPARLTPAVKGHDVLVDGSAVAASHRWRKTGTRHDPPQSTAAGFECLFDQWLRLIQSRDSVKPTSHEERTFFVREYHRLFRRQLEPAAGPVVGQIARSRVLCEPFAE